jgi:nicotinamidase-related amidase
LAIKSVVLCGVQTPNCIRGTATEAIGLDYEVIVLSDATASKSDQVQENNLEGEQADPRCLGSQKNLNNEMSQNPFSLIYLQI